MIGRGIVRAAGVSKLMSRTLWVATAANLVGSRVAPAQEAGDKRSRGDLLRELAQAEAAYQKSSADPAARFGYATLLFQAGEFWKARDLLRPLAQSATASDETLELAARLEFMTGGHDAAERLYDRLIQARAGSAQKQIMATIGKMFVHYQRDQLAKIAALDFPAGVQLPNVTLAKTFDQPPYRLEWHNDRKGTSIPFHAVDPLPQFAIDVNGVPILALFDTGGDALIIDDEVARGSRDRERCQHHGHLRGWSPVEDRVRQGRAGEAR